MDTITGTMQQIILTHAKESGSLEVAWALWTCKHFSAPLSEVVARELEGLDDSITALIALDLMDKGLAPIDPTRAIWTNNPDAGQLYGSNWLLTYEASVRGWLNFGRDVISRDSFFSELKDHNVTFYAETHSQDIELSLVETDEEEEIDETESAGGLGRALSYW